MKIRTKILISFLITLLPAILIGMVSVIQIRRISAPISKDIPENMAMLSKTSELEGYASFIRYYDEVLTQSTRNYAFTGNVYWKNRYYEEVPKLDDMIKLAIEKGDDIDRETFSQINDANLALVGMEEDSMELVDSNKKEMAIEILEGEEYSMQKEIYKKGLMEFVERKGMNYDEAFNASTQNLNQIIRESERLLKTSMYLIILVFVISIIIIIAASFALASKITGPIIKLEKFASKAEENNIFQDLDIQSEDEIGKLARAFNNLISKLRNQKAEVEEIVKQRTADLEKLNSYMTGRELKMIELKKEINGLKQKK